ncbi:hypothetical protein [Planctomycetes bacterium Pla133]|uniref:hypothetical protein n=1 Tax=Engelhardtia mirabilis TaxID=2528011 RepID=UPI0011A079DD
MLPLDSGAGPGEDPAAARDRVRRLEPDLVQRLGEVSDLHFLRLVVVPADERTGQGLRLLLNVIHDRPLDEHLADLTRRAGDVLIDMLGSTAPSGRPMDLPPFLLQHRVRDDALYIGAVGRTVQEIQAERRLRDALAERVDREEASGRWESLDAEAARRELRAIARTEWTGPEFPLGRLPRPTRSQRTLKLVDLALVLTLFPIIGVLGYDLMDAVRRMEPGPKRALTRMGAWIWWLWGAIPTAVAFLVVRGLELWERPLEAPGPTEAELQALEQAEDERPRNELTVWFPVRDNWLSRVLLRVILFGAERGTRHFWADGALAGARNIHYARILQVDGGRSMIFMSDYEGSFDAYIDHFVGIGGNHRAVVPISSRLAGCPKTRWLYLQDDPPSFRPGWKQLIRTYQTDASVWYSAYPDLTCNDVLNHAAIRDGLFADELSDQEARAWARRI